MASKIYNKIFHDARYFLLRRLPACKEIVPLMSESLERKLTLRERTRVRLHLWICAWCAWYIEHLHVLRDAIRLRSAKEDIEDECPPAASLSPDARERLKQALRNGKKE